MGDYSGAMIALVPMTVDAERLAVADGLAAEELHVTLMYLGETDELSPNDRIEALSAAYRISQRVEPFGADAFSVSVFNPMGEDPCVVLLLGGDVLAEIRASAQSMIGERFPQRMPWAPHITLKYTEDFDIDGYVNLTGSVRFDRIRVAFADEVIDMPLGRSLTAAVNGSSWKTFPLAPRETPFSADDAIARALDWSGMSATKFNSIFLWRNSKGEVGNRNNYRLPIADIINGKPTLIPRAVFSAGVIMSGGHGGLEGVVDDKEREEIKRVLTQIYDMLQEEYNDPRVVAPWLLGKTTEERDEAREELGATMWTVEGLIASVNTSGWSDMPVADIDHPWDGEAARKRLWEAADGDFRQYRRGFLWYDPARAEQKNSYKLPIADIVDGRMTIVPRAVNAVAAVLGGARGGVDIPDDDMDDVTRVVKRIQARWEVEAAFPVRNFVQSDMDEECSCDPEDQECGCGDEALEASAAPVYPHSSDFEYKHPADPSQPFTVTADGKASGLLWMWNRCHAGIVDECVMAPRTATNYAYFHNGQVLTSDGKLVKVGKITMGTGHAGPNMKWMPAADHYDNTGTVAAIGRVTESTKGGWFDGVLVSTLSDEQAQELRRSPISGDWRRINGNLELVAALAVNTPGFPIVASINGESQSLVAAGMIVPGEDEVQASGEPEKLTDVEKDLVSQVNDLDQKLSGLAVRGRARKWGKLMASLDERKK